MGYNYEKIGKRIKEQRKALNLSQQELCDYLASKGISMKRATLGKIESGNNTDYHVSFLFCLCDLFKCEMGYLLNEPGYENKTRAKTDFVKETGLSEKAINNLLDYDKGEISVLNTLLSCGLFSQVLQHYGKYLTSEYCIPVHPVGDQWKVSDFDGFDGYGGFLYLASSINNPSDNIPMPFDSSFVEDHEMNQIRDYLKDIKKIATEQIKPLNSKL